MKQKLKNAWGFTPPAPKIKPREGPGHPSLAQLRVLRSWKGVTGAPRVIPAMPMWPQTENQWGERRRQTLWRHLWHRKVTDVCQASAPRATRFTFTHLKDRSTIMITSPCLRRTGSATTHPFTWVGLVELKLTRIAYRAEERGNSGSDDWVKSATKREKTQNKTDFKHPLTSCPLTSILQCCFDTTGSWIRMSHSIPLWGKKLRVWGCRNVFFFFF